MDVKANAPLAMARLARLDLKADLAALGKMASDFERIVGYMDILAEIDTQGVEPMYSPMVEPLGPRPDEPLARDERKADDILAEAPERVGRFFSVPRVV
ncbi:MAG: Asp-tRNA(Asn)/Glu-tRNA(Gln) amidotransferase subunit GatC [Deltaproteobacteria bacterium]|jgi:aspartyl-tRNA(Asn)/glutamyl-tRNA(Gln) amidotransferase subunit C|nr:Asp-tRNA(Asn)/Glu-tRNA(Gln) amidotransferase subunit GatC [Deltaproteobacteria bacterium]